MSEVQADRLKSFIERIERLEEEGASIAGDKRDVYAEAKGIGYDVKTMRRVVQLRKMDAADRAEQETLLDVYKHALSMGDEDMEAQADTRAMKRLREIDRCMRLTNGEDPPRIEAIMRELDCSSGKASTLRKLCAERMAVVSISTDLQKNEIETPAHNPETGEISETAGAVPPGDGGAPAKTSAAGPAVATITDAAEADMLAAADHLAALKREKGIAA